MECKEPVNLESLQRDGKDTPNSWRYSVVKQRIPGPGSNITDRYRDDQNC
jgi:hypothetical protein